VTCCEPAPCVLTTFTSPEGGSPGNGQPLPEESKIANLQWKPKQSAGAAFAVDIADYEPASDKLVADPIPSDCGHACKVAVKAKSHLFRSFERR